MIASLIPWLIDALVLVGLLIMTVAVYGMIRMPDIYMQLHAASKGIVVGVIPILLSTMLLGDFAITARALLIGFFLLITTPVSSHVIGRVAYLKGEPMRRPSPLDESGALPHEPD